MPWPVLTASEEPDAALLDTASRRRASMIGRVGRALFGSTAALSLSLSMAVASSTSSALLSSAAAQPSEAARGRARRARRVQAKVLRRESLVAAGFVFIVGLLSGR